MVAAWQQWASDAPDGLAASLKIAAARADGPVQVILFGAMLGPEADTATLLARSP